MGVIALLTGWVYWQAGDDAWQTMLFTVLTLSQMFHVLAIHQERGSLFGAGFLTNPLLLGRGARSPSCCSSRSSTCPSCRTSSALRRSTSRIS